MAWGPQEIASVNGSPITRAQFDAQYQKMLSGMKLTESALNVPQMKPFIEMMKQNIVSNLINDKIVMLEAEKRKLKVSTEEFKMALNQQYAQLGGKTKFEEALKQQKMSANEFNDYLKAAIMRDKVATAVGGKTLEVSDAQAKAYFQAHPDEFKLPERVRAQHILIGASKQSLLQEISKDKKLAPTDVQKKVDAAFLAKQKEAEAILKEALANPEAFGQLAKTKSDDKGSAVKEGDLDYFTKEQMVPTFLGSGLCR